MHFPFKFFRVLFRQYMKIGFTGWDSYFFFEIFSCFILNNLGLRLGSIGLDCFAFLFLPVARGSVLLRLINIPFEQAIRYHVWLGHLTMLLFTLHGLIYVISWTIEGNLLQNVSAKGVILFLLHSHIYTYVFLFSLYIYLLVCLPKEEYIYNHYWKLNYPLAIYI